MRRERVADVDGGRKRRARSARGRRRVGVEDGEKGDDGTKRVAVKLPWWRDAKRVEVQRRRRDWRRA